MADVRGEPKDENDNSREPDNCSTSMATSSEEEEIDFIVGHKIQKSQYMYRIRWSGYTSDDDTWEPADNLLGSSALSILKEYRERYGLGLTPPKKARTPQNSTPRSHAPNPVRSHSSTPQAQAVVRPVGNGDTVDMDNTDDTGWFGVKGDETDRELKHLFVSDRKLTTTERLLNDIHAEGGRLTRSQIKDMLPVTSDSATSPENSQPTPKKRKASASPQKKDHKKKPKLDEDGRATPKAKPHAPKFTPDAPKSRPEEFRKVKSYKKEKPTSKAKQSKYKEEQEEDSDEDVIPLESRKTGKPPTLSRGSSTSSGSRRPSVERKPKSHKFVAKESLVNKPRLPNDPVRDTAVPVHSAKGVVQKAVFPTNSFLNSYKIQKKKADEPRAFVPAAPAPKPTPKFEEPKPSPVPVNQRTVQFKSEQLSITECALNGASLNKILREVPVAPVNKPMTQQDFLDAVNSNKVALLKVALANGVPPDVNLREGGRTLLHQLAESVCDQQHLQDDVIDLLVNHGARMEERDARGLTPLHAAILSRRYCHALKLMRLGSPINNLDAEQEHILTAAMRTAPAEISAELLARGAHLHLSLKPRNNLPKNQLQVATKHACRLQQCMDQARAASFQHALRHENYTNVFQTELFNQDLVELSFERNAELAEDLPNATTFLGLALATFVDGVCFAQYSGDSPVHEVQLNGRRLSLANPRNKYVFVAPRLDNHKVHRLTVRLVRGKAHSFCLLLCQLFGSAAAQEEAAPEVREPEQDGLVHVQQD